MKMQLFFSLLVVTFLLGIVGCDNNRSRKKSAGGGTPDAQAQSPEAKAAEGAQEKAILVDKEKVTPKAVAPSPKSPKTLQSKGQSRLSNLERQNLPDHFQSHQKLLAGQNLSVKKFIPNKGEKAFDLTVACVSSSDKARQANTRPLQNHRSALELSTGHDVVLSVVPENETNAGNSKGKKYLLVSCSEKVTPKSKSNPKQKSNTITKQQEKTSLLSLNTRTNMVSAVRLEKSQPLSLVSCVRDIVTLTQYGDHSFEGGVMVLQDSAVVVTKDTVHTGGKGVLKVVCKI